MKFNMKTLLIGGIVLAGVYSVGKYNGAMKCVERIADGVVEWLDEDEAIEVTRLLEKARINKHKKI